MRVKIEIFSMNQKRNRKKNSPPNIKRNATEPNKTKPNAIDINEELHTQTNSSPD